MKAAEFLGTDPVSVIAYNLGNLWRRLALLAFGRWSLTSLQQRLVKTGGWLIQLAGGIRRAQRGANVDDENGRKA